MSEKFDYKRYLASREWALLREAVKKRSAGYCERCPGNDEVGPRDMAATHHLTYERIGHEDLTDLLAVCSGCHEFLSGKSDLDPIELDIRAAVAGVREGLGMFADQRGKEYEEDARIILEGRIERWTHVLIHSELAKANQLPIAADLYLSRIFEIHIKDIGEGK